MDRPVEPRDQGLRFPASRGLARRQARLTRHLRLWQLILPAALFLAVYFVVPLLLLFWWSFRAPGVAGLTLANFQKLLGDAFFLQTLWLSVRLSLEVTAVTLVLGFPLAYLYTRLGPGPRVAILFITLLPLLTSAVVRSFAWIVILGKEGLINVALLGAGLVDAPVKLLFTHEGVRIAMAQVQLPFMLLPLINAMEQLDPTLEKAAISLGASQARAFFRVTVPLSAPGIVAGAILSFALTVSAFITPAMVGGGSYTVMPTLIYQSAIITLDWSTASTTAFILLVVALIVVWGGMAVAQRYRYGPDAA
jgi:putative spermidine/putrescine transport system permease protein